jgi:predicted Kef-type K+ transport protein
MFAEHDLAHNIPNSCDDMFAVIFLVSVGLGVSRAPQWTKEFPNRNF